MLSALKMNLNIESGVSDAKWASDEQILVGTDRGEILLYKINKTNNNLENDKFDLLMKKSEHDNVVTCLGTCLNSGLGLSGSDDARYYTFCLRSFIFRKK